MSAMKKGGVSVSENVKGEKRVRAGAKDTTTGTAK